jgi:anthranilate synthase component 1
MMLRAEHGQVQLRPISGTAPRGQNPIDDHEIMLQLLMSEKEKSELDMLVDLGRNDLARVCQPGVWVDRYRYVERYSRVMHTVAQVSGTLAPGLTGYEALLAALPAGTLSGAPKLAAMRYIDALEPFRRGWYGGAVGYLLLSGEVDTGIVIRTAHIRGHELRYCSGATLLFDSLPEAELRETQHKAAAFLGAFAPLEA